VLRERGALSGNDFLPVVVGLDELITHLSQVRAMHERIGPLQWQHRTVPAAEEVQDAHRHSSTTPEQPAAPGQAKPAAAGRGQLLAEMLRALALQEARALGRSVRLLTRGLGEIPPGYAQMVKEVCIQMIRNAIAHGIEPPAQRARLGKPEEGTVQISFAIDDAGQYALTVEDDGRGLNYEQIVERALRLDLLSPQQALALDWANIYRLIFQPGFSTAAEVSEHAGRGVGLDAVSTRVGEVGGKIGVDTTSGSYTRFSVQLPSLDGQSAASVA
jgi:signal transduction histidine kinase